VRSTSDRPPQDQAGGHELRHDLHSGTTDLDTSARRYVKGVAQGDSDADQHLASAAGGAGGPGTARSAEGAGEAGTTGSAAETEEAEYEYYEDDEELGEPVETIDEQGRRHIHRAAPDGTEQILENEAPRHTGLPDRAERWRMRSATGTVLTAFAFGLKEVFEPNRNQPSIVMETSGDPPTDLPIEAHLNQIGPRQSSVTVRPHLLGNNLPNGGRSQAPPEAVESRGNGAAQAADAAPDDPRPSGPTEGDEASPR
jgi:hypothetical protein